MSIPYCSHLRPSLGLLLGLLVLAGVGAGCQAEPEKSRGSANITITFGGQPVTEGTVSLQNAEGEGGGAPLDPMGVAKVPNVVEGNYIVTVTPPLPKVAPPEPGKTNPGPKDYSNIPEKFRRTETSPLKADIVDTINDFSFDLKK